MPLLSLARRADPLASPARQLEVLADCAQPAFARKVAQCGQAALSASTLRVLQVNVGKLCNQTCRHCHVDAGPDRTEQMTAATAEACLKALAQPGLTTLDITGGAPEMSPVFRRLVEGGRELARQVLVRSNLTILIAPGYGDLPEFLADHQVEVCASLPCYLAENTDRQRGSGVFERSLAALRRLNELGYGDPASGLVLTLVFNPGGSSLPPPQAELEAAYHRELAERYSIRFNRLLTLANMPISRFLEDLLSTGQVEAYLEKLVQAFNPETLAGVMCREMVSVGWDGRLYDCDFNQMLELPLAAGLPRTIDDLLPGALDDRAIVTHQHCYGCTAGAGSSCGGALLGKV